jgi:hypothetical protein
VLRQFKLFRLLCPLTLCGLRFAWWVTFRSLPPLTVLRQILGRYFFFLVVFPFVPSVYSIEIGFAAQRRRGRRSGGEMADGW